MLSLEEARTRVAKGAAHLDHVRPGWHERIDVGTLTLWDPCGCIVGQLCGLTKKTSFFAAVNTLAADRVGMGFDLDADFSSMYFAAGPGKYEPWRQAQFQPLQDAWIEAIADRKLSQAAGDPALRPVTEEERQKLNAR